MALESWSMRGEVVRSCGCTNFCPCALARAPDPSDANACQSWAVFRIDRGHFGETDLSGLKLGLMLDVPGPIDRGNWSVALFVDRAASIYAEKALLRIFSGKADGSAAPFAAMTGKLVGAERAEMAYDTDGSTRTISIAALADATVTPTPGRDPEKDVTISNAGYWIGSEIIVARAGRSRLRAHGRNWNFGGRSAEICKLDWRGA